MGSGFESLVSHKTGLGNADPVFVMGPAGRAGLIFLTRQDLKSFDISGINGENNLVEDIKMKKIGVMFVCLGNICRSPMGEAIFRDLVEKAGLGDRFVVASSGTGSWHIGERPHYGTLQVLKKHQIDAGNKKAQQFTGKDLNNYKYIVAMDANNAADVNRRFGGNLPRLLEFAPQGSPLDVPDPYYENNFDEVYTLVKAGCEGLLAHIRKQEGL